MQVQVYRHDPLTEAEGRFETFEVPVVAHWTAMDVLDYISTQLDSTLAYFKHSACDHGVCGRCALRVNGKVRLACSADISGETSLEIGPMNRNVVRDLVMKCDHKASSDG